MLADAREDGPEPRRRRRFQPWGTPSSSRALRSLSIAVREARLHRARWTVECLGHLGLRELFEVPQRHDEPILSIEAVESLDHPTALRVADGDVLGRRDLTAGIRDRGPHVELGSASARASVVAGQVRDDPQEPGAERPSRVEGVHRLPRSLCRLLHHVVGSIW